MTRSFASFRNLWSMEAVAPVFFGQSTVADLSQVKPRDANWAMPHFWTPAGCAQITAWQSYDNAGAAGAIVSCAEDMAKWLSFNVGRGSHDGERLISRRSFDELFRTQNEAIDLVQYPFTGETYALGWRRAHYRDQLVVSHGGGIIGFPAWIAVMPDHRIGVTILSNGSSRATERLGTHKAGLHRSIALWVFDRLLGAPPRDWSTSLLARAATANVEWCASEDELDATRDAGAPCRPLAAYRGTFEDAAGNSGQVKIAEQSGRLYLRFPGAGAYAAELEPWGGDKFRLRSHPSIDAVVGAEHPFVTFRPDGHGRILSFDALGSCFTVLPRAASHTDGTEEPADEP